LHSRRDDRARSHAREPDHEVTVDDKGNMTTSSEGSGQTTEIVVTKDTQVYRDVTAPNPSEPTQDGAIQQKVEPGSLDEIGENSTVMAWGERRGERLVARALMYSKPMIMMAPINATQ
jgi:hypothetical protein